MEKINIAWTFILLAFSAFASFIAPGSEEMFTTMTLIILIHGVSSVLVGIKEKRLGSIFSRDSLVYLIGCFILIYFASQISSIGGENNVTLVQVCIAGVIGWQSVRVVRNLSTLGVPIPDKLIEIIDGMDPDKEIKNKTQGGV